MGLKLERDSEGAKSLQLDHDDSVGGRSGKKDLIEQKAKKNFSGNSSSFSVNSHHQALNNNYLTWRIQALIKWLDSKKKNEKRKEKKRIILHNFLR